MKLKDMPRVLRPREKLVEKGVEYLSNAELLALLLRSGVVGTSVVELSRRIIKRYSPASLTHIGYDDLITVHGINQAKACTILAAFELSKRAAGLGSNALPEIQKSIDAAAQLTFIRNRKKEYFVVLYLNTRDQLMKREIISVGTLDSSLIHPREVFQPAIACNAARVILGHNHPSGDHTPSTADRSVTRRIVEAGKILGISVRDHIVISEHGYSSMADKDMLQ